MLSILQQSTLPNITTTFYNDLFDDPFITSWNNCLSETFKHLLPWWLTLTSTRDLENCCSCCFTARDVEEGGDSAAHDLIAAKRLGFNGIGDANWNKCPPNQSSIGADLFHKTLIWYNLVLHLLQFNPDLIKFDTEFITIYAEFITIQHSIHYNLTQT